MCSFKISSKWKLFIFPSMSIQQSKRDDERHARFVEKERKRHLRIVSTILPFDRTRPWPFDTSGNCLTSNRTNFSLVVPLADRSRRRFSFFSLQFSICRPLRELKNPGASGSLFYLTSDDEFILKTVQKKEAEFLKRLLPAYYMVNRLVSTRLVLIASNFYAERHTKSAHPIAEVLRSLLLSGT